MKEALQISSPAFGRQGVIPEKYYSTKGNINPPFVVDNVPPEAKNLVLYVEDPDTNGNTVLWSVWNIDPKTAEIPEDLSFDNGDLPGAVEGRNDLGKIGYTGPTPSHWGYHRIIFRLYALDKKLDLPGGASKGKLKEAIARHVIAKSHLVGACRHHRKPFSVHREDVD
ncbi:MAG: YbhB/YbcL family Raf kinase inhibitor-like protein [Patescibacteria group bacterium]